MGGLPVRERKVLLEPCRAAQLPPEDERERKVPPGRRHPGKERSQAAGGSSRDKAE
jgi:hypothetical protein